MLKITNYAEQLLEGLDDIALTMQSESVIDVFEKWDNTPSIFS